MVQLPILGWLPGYQSGGSGLDLVTALIAAALACFGKRDEMPPKQRLQGLIEIQ